MFSEFGCENVKTIVINADPKMKEDTARLLKSAMKGAESAGSKVEYVNLYKLDIRGCMNCSICKTKNKESFKCYWRDGLSPIIEKILNADALLIGSQIFFNEPTSHYRALLERLIFCIVSFNEHYFKGKVNVGIFYTVLTNKERFEKYVFDARKLELHHKGIHITDLKSGFINKREFLIRCPRCGKFASKTSGWYRRAKSFFAIHRCRACKCDMLSMVEVLLFADDKIKYKKKTNIIEKVEL